MRMTTLLLAIALVLLASVMSGTASRALAASEGVAVELCVDGEVVIVRMDADGQPIGPFPNCPQTHECCMIPDMPDVVLSSLGMTVPGSPHDAAPLPRSANLAHPLSLSPGARGPPAVGCGPVHQMDSPA